MSANPCLLCNKPANPEYTGSEKNNFCVACWDHINTPNEYDDEPDTRPREVDTPSPKGMD